MITPTSWTSKARRATPQANEIDYGRSVRSFVYGLWAGVLDGFGFVDGMAASIRRGFTQAWNDGARICGISPSEMSEEEQDRLQREINQEITYLSNFANDIIAASKASGGLLRVHTARIPMWVNSYARIRELAKMLACKDRKAIWKVNPLKEHCTDCLHVDGRVYRMSIWRKYGWEPRSRNLECRGYKCGCTLEFTDLPATPGRPPRLAGAI